MFERINRRDAMRLAAMAAVSGAAALFGWPVATIHSQYGDLPNSLPMPALPAITGARVIELLPSAFTTRPSRCHRCAPHPAGHSRQVVGKIESSPGLAWSAGSM